MKESTADAVRELTEHYKRVYKDLGVKRVRAMLWGAKQAYQGISEVLAMYEAVERNLFPDGKNLYFPEAPTDLPEIPKERRPLTRLRPGRRR